MNTFNHEATMNKCKVKTVNLNIIKMQTCKSDTVMIDQAYAEKILYTVIEDWEIKAKNNKKNQQWFNRTCDAKPKVMHHLTDTLGEQNANCKKTY